MTTQPKKTIYKAIQSQISNDGYLPDGFSLDDFRKKNAFLDFTPIEKDLSGKDIQITFGVVDGCMDGIIFKHANIYKIAEKNIQIADRILTFLSSDEDLERKMKMLEAFGKKHRAISMVDVFTHTLAVNSKKYDVNCLKDSMIEILIHTTDIESVKYALETFEVMELGRKIPKAAELIRMFGVCEEFTLFALFNMEYWDKPNDEFFWLARHTHGWGRVHAVHMLKPSSTEIKDWLLFEGWENDISKEYLADECYQKSDVESRKLRGLTRKEYAAVKKMEPYLH